MNLPQKVVYEYTFHIKLPQETKYQLKDYTAKTKQSQEKDNKVFQLLSLH